MKQLFLTRSFREKVLLLAFVALGAFTWWLGLGQRVRDLSGEWRSLQSEQAAQNVWLENRDAISARSAAAAQLLDPAHTLNGPRLVAELNALAMAAGLSAEVSGLRTETADRFAFHSVQVTFRRVELSALVRFYAELTRRSPYLGLEQLSLATDRGAPGQLNASLRVVAAELVP